MTNDQKENILQADETVFKTKFDRVPFALDHGIVNHQLFEFPRLLHLAQSLKVHPDHVVYDAGDIRVDHRWNQRPKNTHTLEEVLDRIDCTGAWVIFKHTERDPEYHALMHLIMARIDQLSGQNLTSATKNLEAQIMITSPGRVTPYHMDNECNILLQLQGEKDLYVFDRADREVLTEAELERFWIGDWNAGEYKSRCQDRAHAFRLAPGKAAHIPVNSPHWVKNDNNISVSLSINFEWKNEKTYNVYRANYFLRKAGITPQPPGLSTLSDTMKSGLMAASFVPARKAARNTLRFLRRVKKSVQPKSVKKSAKA